VGPWAAPRWVRWEVRALRPRPLRLGSLRSNEAVQALAKALRALQVNFSSSSSSSNGVPKAAAAAVVLKAPLRLQAWEVVRVLKTTIKAAVLRRPRPRHSREWVWGFHLRVNSIKVR